MRSNSTRPAIVRAGAVVAATALVTAVFGGATGTGTEPAAAGGCSVNYYTLTWGSAGVYRDATRTRLIKVKHRGAPITGPNGVEVRGGDSRMVYVGRNEIGWMNQFSLRYDYCR